MALPNSIPYTFANATTSIPLSQLDTDISTIYATVNGIGNGTVALANVVITGGIVSNVSLSNVSGVSVSSIANGTSNVSVSALNGNVTVATAGVNALTIDTSQNVTTSSSITSGTSVSDLKGNVRQLPINNQTSAYVLIAGDTGKTISITTGGVTVNSGIFSAGDNITIYNNSSSNQTITQGTSVTIRQAGTANTGSRTLAQYGICTLLCVASNTFTISGAGLS